MKSKPTPSRPLKRVPVVTIAMGSDSDLPVMSQAATALKLFAVPYRMRILSAHRTPQEVADFAISARKDGVQVIIAGAGGAAHLPGMIAAYTELPVIGVPVPLEPLKGQDSLLSIVQMPKGVPVATVAIGNAFNAGILAVQILGATTKELGDRVLKYKQGLAKEVREKDRELRV